MPPNFGQQKFETGDGWWHADGYEVPVTKSGFSPLLGLNRAVNETSDSNMNPTDFLTSIVEEEYGNRSSELRFGAKPSKTRFKHSCKE